ncbi:MAG: hypothetical protein AB7O57_07525 [Hyphomicrobiaceae bacterium]
MLTFIVRLMGQIGTAARIMVPTFGVAGILVMSRTPDLWAMTDADGKVNSLPFVTIACLAVTLVMLIRWRQP